MENDSTESGAGVLPTARPPELEAHPKCGDILDGKNGRHPFSTVGKSGQEVSIHPTSEVWYEFKVG